ncbi:hypothetical protein [Cryobacterium cheniae]|nr:hypothetical protein [Cryobacterium cheniae]
MSIRYRTRKIRRWSRRREHTKMFQVTRIAVIVIVAVPTLVLVARALQKA